MVGGWWHRRFSPEIDLVGADRGPVAGTSHFAGSVKWLGKPFDRHDLTALAQGAAKVPGFTPGTSGLAVVSLSATPLPEGEIELVWGPRDVVAAWRP
ncbi:hypothetical protein OK006_11002 [Actinobacteria bacterium OK006]|nr:hypothetical protein OK006_11002 [Actinobacteria bacterium OK006]